MIRSKIENDTYKWNIAYFYWLNYPFAELQWEFKDRKKEEFNSDFVERFNMEISKLGMLNMTESEYNFLTENFSWIPRGFFQWFYRCFRFDPSNVVAWLDDDSHFHFKFGEGIPAYESTFYEIPCLSIFTELREEFFGLKEKINLKESMNIIKEQVDLSNRNELKFSEFGLRRRFSSTWQDKVDEYIAQNAKYCTGNSNVYLAYKLGQKVSGTMAHEIFMTTGAFKGYTLENYETIEGWIHAFKGNVGTYLLDTIGIDQALNNLTMLQAKVADGFRWDSGSWESFTTKLINRLRELKVNPLHKGIVYSDSINIQTYDDINNNVKGRIGWSAAGIGGALTNNIVLDNAPDCANKVECVCKVHKARINKKSPWIDCVKCPDTPGKYMGEKHAIEVCLKTIGREDELSLVK